MKFQVEIVKMVPPGEGLGYYNDKTVFVPGSTVGDVVEVSILKQKSRHIIAALEKVLVPGPERIAAPCPHYDLCGGCSLMHLSYANQLALKKQLLMEVFSNQPLAEPPLFVASPREFQFRYRANVKLENGVLGFAAKHSHQLVDIHDCRTLKQELVERLPVLLKLGRNRCEFSLLASTLTSESAICVSENNRLIPLPGYSASLQEDYGFGALTLNCAGFAQSNPFVTALIGAELLRYVKPSDRVWDLYCGCGTFSLPVASRVETLVGCDISKQSIATAIQNASSQHLDNTSFYVANLDHGLKKSDCSLILADPPKNGLSKQVLQQIGKSTADRLLYVSCNPASQARDTKALEENYGFRLVALTGYDMYCHATHSETLAVLQR